MVVFCCLKVHSMQPRNKTVHSMQVSQGYENDFDFDEVCLYINNEVCLYINNENRSPKLL